MILDRNGLAKMINELPRICVWLTAACACCCALAQQPPGWQFDRDVNLEALPTAPPGFEVSLFASGSIISGHGGKKCEEFGRIAGC